mmetsp:Transcript_12687/g.19508  ORF Transcript_12687/g.19508 Transcript_12687/m.19508 type:complete len:855 (-) Transcript_12687:194-2758(-)
MLRVIAFIQMIEFIMGIVMVNNNGHHHGCRTNASSLSHQHNVDEFILSKKHARSGFNNLCKQCIVIDTYMTIFLPLSNASTTVLNERGVTTAWREQMNALNKAFAESPFRFELQEEEPTIVQNDTWHADFFVNQQEYDQSWPRTLVHDYHRQGEYQALNLYFGAALQEDYYGFATYPQPGGLSVAPIDGVYCTLQTLPNDATSDCCRNHISSCCSLGYTAVHEIGHWLGLEHTFATQTGIPCDPNDLNDFVVDTPQQRYPTWEECPSKPRDSCPFLPGDDPFTNVMDYALDSCVEPPFFTPGQIERMWYVWQLYRVQQIDSECPELLELVLVGNTYHWQLSGSISFQWDSMHGNFDWHRPAPLVNHVDICWRNVGEDFQLTVSKKEDSTTIAGVFPSYWYLRYRDRDVVPVLSENTTVFSSLDLKTASVVSASDISIKEFIWASLQHSLFKKAILFASSWVLEALQDRYSRLTLAAPDDQALMAILPPSFSAMLTSDNSEKSWEEHWSCFVTSFLIPGKRSLDDSGIIRTGYGNKLLWADENDDVVVNDSFFINQTTSNLRNGIAHTLSLLPTTARSPLTSPSCMSQNLEMQIRNDSATSIFLSLLEIGNLKELLSLSAPLTVMVPTNKAFDDLKSYYYDYYYYEPATNMSLWEHMLQDQSLLIQVLKLHMIPSIRTFNSRMVNQTYVTMGSPKDGVEFGMYWEDIYEEDPVYGVYDGAYYAKVLESNQVCSNGIFHKIDMVLFPFADDTTSTTSPSSSPLALIGMDSTLQPVVSPTNMTTPNYLLPEVGVSQPTVLPSNSQPTLQPISQSEVISNTTIAPVAGSILPTYDISPSTKVTTAIAIFLPLACMVCC